MKDTAKRIRAYKAALPGLKERLAAVALLLVVSTVMMISATFAWITLSRAPEVTGINTTISGNGNLEIALSDKDGKEPDTSAIGDSSATDGQTIQNANLTWGNLVNLTDGYGLDNLTLRPAMLNMNGLKNGSPLWGASYKEDGRIDKLQGDFAFTTWQEAHDGLAAAFVVPTADAYGVRAISSVTYKNLSGDTTFTEMWNEAERAGIAAGSAYTNITTNQAYMSSLSGLIGVYASGKIGGDNIVTDYVDSFYNMMVDFQGAMDLEGEALAKEANIMQFLKQGQNYTPYTRETLLSASKASLTSNGITESFVNGYLADYKNACNSLKTALTGMKTQVDKAKDGQVIYWNNIASYVNRLVDTGSCTLDGIAVSSIGVSNALGFLDGKTHEAVIHKGLLYDFEKRNGANMYAAKLTVHVKGKVSVVKVDEDISANVYTDLKDTGTNMFADDLAAIKKNNSGNYVGGDAVAEDTYGLALDVWLRTNASNSVLTLEGNVLTETTYEDVKTSYNGQEYDVYTASVTVEGQTASIDVIQVNGKWLTLGGEEVTPNGTPAKKQNAVTTVTGVEGANRVWQDNPLLTDDSTTQGQGSFYIYYADTPEDGAKSLELMQNIKVAFVDGNNNFLAAASMDTENVYSLNGKYHIPLKITQGGVSITDTSGNEIRGITMLPQNQALRITALLYLDGTNLGNDMVLANSDIQGKLNIQFGSTSALESAGDEKLEMEARSVSAEVSKTSFSWDTDTDFTTQVRVTVQGVQPKNVSARFQRVISATQGTRMEEIAFTHNESDGTWTGSYAFPAPGVYKLISVTLDGVEMELDEAQTVTVTGFTIGTVNMDTTAILTADRSADRDVSVSFATADKDKLPKTVQGVFTQAGSGNVNTVTFAYNTTQNLWTGKVTFNTSGTYTLQYLVLDGAYTELVTGQQKTIDVKLGMKTRVYITRDNNGETEILTDADGNIVYETDVNGNYKLDENGDKIPVRVPVSMPLSFKFMGDPVNFAVSAVIMDDQGNAISGLTDVKLVYLKSGSNLQENGLSAPLTWNAGEGRYMGKWQLTKAGIYSFGWLSVGSNTITQAVNPLTITAMSPEPPAYQAGSAGVYNGNDKLEYVFTPDNDAAFRAVIGYSNSATKITAYFTKDGGTTLYESVGTIGNAIGENANYWTFQVPVDSGSQDGTWKMVKLACEGVYDKANNLYDENNPMELAVTDSPEVKVVCVVNVSFNKDQATQQFGGTSLATATAHFMDSHTGSYELTIADKEGNPLQNVQNVQLSIEHLAGSSKTHGGYTFTENIEGTTAMEKITLNMTAAADGIHYSADQTFQLAGVYMVKTLSFNVSGRDYTYTGETMPSNSPKVEVYSMQPTVRITGLNPDPSKTYEVNVGDMSGHAIGRETHTYISEDGLYAYMSAEMGGVVAGFTSVTWPKMTLALSDSGNAFTQADLQIPKGNGDSARTYTFKPGSLSSTQTIGTTSGSRKPADYQKVETVSFVSNGITYQVTLKQPIEIYEVEQPIGTLTFDVSSSMTNPPEKIEIPRRSMSVTLPDAPNYTELVSSDSTTPGTRQQVTSTTRSVYYRKAMANYQTIDITTKTYKTPYTGESFNVTYQVTGWIITGTKASDGTVTVLNNGKAYAPGTKVNLALGTNYVAVPVLEEVSRVSAGTRTTYFYVEETTAGSPYRYWVEPSGEKFNNEATMKAYVQTQIGTKELGWRDN